MSTRPTLPCRGWPETYHIKEEGKKTKPVRSEEFTSHHFFFFFFLTMKESSLVPRRTFVLAQTTAPFYVNETSRKFSNVRM